MNREETFHSIFKKELTDFLDLRRDTKSKGTADHDRHYLKLFDGYLCSSHHAVRAVTQEVTAGWVSSLTFSDITVANAINTVRCFLKYLQFHGISAYVPPVPKYHDDYLPYLFSDEELDRIFRNADSFTFSKSKRFPYIKAEIPMILRLLLGCGLRLGEAVCLKVADIDSKTGSLTLKHTKKDKQRHVPMHPALTDTLSMYCLSMGIAGNPDAWVFPGETSETHLTKMNVWHRFDTILKKSGISLPGRKKNERGPCLHCLRHLFVLKSFRQLGRDGHRVDDAIPYLSLYLGHESLKESEKYMKFSSEIFPEEMECFAAFTKDIFPEVDDEE